jgi:hypothetical protein
LVVDGRELARVSSPHLRRDQMAKT